MELLTQIDKEFVLGRYYVTMALEDEDLYVQVEPYGKLPPTAKIATVSTGAERVRLTVYGEGVDQFDDELNDEFARDQLGGVFIEADRDCDGHFTLFVTRPDGGSLLPFQEERIGDNTWLGRYNLSR